jgi:guanine nucleotide-binding protein subunit alpha
MDSVFDVILKENLRKMDVVDVEKMMAGDAATGKSTAKFPASYAPDTIILCACWYTENLKERNVLVETPANAKLPGVEIGAGYDLKKDMAPDFMTLMNLPKVISKYPPTSKGEIGSFFGNFKDAVGILREKMGIADTEELGYIYDIPVFQKHSNTTIIPVVRLLPSKDAVPVKGPWGWVTHETFEDAHLKQFAGVDTAAKPCKAPDKNAEFNPFAANPVGDRWFKGVTLFTAQINRIPDKGVYLGVMKIVSTTGGFKIMVNEHNRIMIPLIFLTCTQLPPDELKWMQGVRIRQNKKIDLLEGKKPNMGWLGPEMSGEEGATFAEKMWWAIDEGKSRLSTEDLGNLYDAEVLDVDENDNIQLVMYACLAKDEADILPGHIWVDRQFLEIQNMKFLCPKTLQALLAEQAELMNAYKDILSKQGGDFEQAKAMREQKEKKKIEIENALIATTPLKWINRTIMWCADKMPSFGDKIPGAADMDAPTLVEAALKANAATDKCKADRSALIAKYKK